jgi:hypothetical protein
MVGFVKYNFLRISSNYETMWSGIVRVDPRITEYRLDHHF